VIRARRLLWGFALCGVLAVCGGDAALADLPRIRMRPSRFVP
jgi:hypothetical protein